MRTAAILSLKPTQFSMGLEEINARIKHLTGLSKKDLSKFLHERPIPVVISPKKKLYLIDHHHLLHSCWQIGVKEVEIEIRADLSHLKITYKKFWKTMVKSHWAYLYDQFGDGPREPLYLPPDIRGLANDPYRSLAWTVRCAGGYTDTHETFADMKWAELFRKHKFLKTQGHKSIEEVLDRAIRLAKSKHAQDLPGYKGKPITPKVKLSKVDRATKA